MFISTDLTKMYVLESICSFYNAYTLSKQELFYSKVSFQFAP